MPLTRLTRISLLIAPLWFTTFAPGDPTTRRLDVDFSRVVPSRNLNGLAARSDGRLVLGPSVKPIEAMLPELVWCLEPDGSSGWLVGSGADGKVVQLKIAGESVTVVEAADFAETNVFAICSTGPGEFLAGTAPGGVLYLVKDRSVVARTPLGADVIWDIKHLDGDDYLIATGSPAKIFKVTLAQFRESGVAAPGSVDGSNASNGIAKWAEIRDRNVRRLIVADGGRVLAGSSPRGAIYEFQSSGGQAFILHESKDAEVADLLVTPDGTLYAALTYNALAPERRTGPRPTPPSPPPESPAPSPAEFAGRSEVVRIARNGFPEVVIARNGLAFYRLAAFGDFLLVGGGEQGEILGYHSTRRMLLTFPGAPSSQVNGIAAVPGSPGRFLLLRNNFSGLAFLDFTSAGERTAETRKLEFDQPSTIGLLQFSRLRDLPAGAFSVEYRFGNSADEGEGWSDWLPAIPEGEGFRLGDSRARFARIKIRVPASMSSSAEIGRATIFHMPQNRPPAVQDFRVFPPGLGLIPMPEPPAPASLPLAQFLFPNQPQAQPETAAQSAQKNSFLASQIVSQPGNQLVYWTVSDPDGDNLTASVALRLIGSPDWTEIASDITNNFLGFSTAELPEGPYELRLKVSETAPRPESDRQFVLFESDDLTVDRTPPEILDITQSTTDTAHFFRVSTRDRWSLIRGVRAVLNNGVEIETILPEDGILDGRSEVFRLEVPLVATTGATNAEIMVVDQAGNRTAWRIPLKP